VMNPVQEYARAAACGSISRFNCRQYLLSPFCSTRRLLRRRLYHGLLLLLTLSYSLVLLGTPELLQAQRHFGIVWEPGQSNERELARELFTYQQTGIRTLMIRNTIDYGLIELLAGFDFDVIVWVPNDGITASRMANREDKLLHEVLRHTAHYRNLDFIKGYVVFAYGQVNSRNFADRSASLLAEVRNETDLPVLHIQTRQENRFQDDISPDGVILRLSHPELPTGAGTRTQVPLAGFIWQPERNFSIRDFQEFMDATRSAAELPFFMPSGWVLQHLDAGLGEALILYAADPDARIPNPRPEPLPPPFNWQAVLLLIVWLSFAAHYAWFPNYNKSIIRFFTNHTFFVDDLFERRIRFSTTPLFLNLQTAVLFGLFTSSIFTFHFSGAGLEVLRLYLPLPALVDPGFFFFVAGFLFKLLFSLLMTIWVFAPSLDMQWASPAAVTYIWPQHVQLPVVTLLVTTALASGPVFMFNLLTVVFVLIWLSSFYVAAYSVRKYAERRNLYDFLSWALQSVFIAGMVWWIFSHAGIWDVLQLAAFTNG
jgi:hypothetical protein